MEWLLWSVVGTQPAVNTSLFMSSQEMLKTQSCVPNTARHSFFSLTFGSHQAPLVKLLGKALTATGLETKFKLHTVHDIRPFDVGDFNYV